VIEGLTDAFSDATFSQARDVYEKGGYSKSVATVSLPTALTSRIDAGTDVQGLAEDGSVALMFAFAEAAEGAVSLELQYRTSEAGGTTCNVGGLPSPITTGCLAANGTLTVTGGTAPISYLYNALEATRNERTLQGFSTGWQSKMLDEQDGQPYKHFKLFSDYYGSETYADQFVTAALTGAPASVSNFNADFSSYALESRAGKKKKLPTIL
jgi:hypothetical protein